MIEENKTTTTSFSKILDETILKETSIGLIKNAIELAIPVIGRAINEAIFETAGRIRQQRINDFVSELSKKVEKINKSKIDHDYLISEDFYDLTVSVFEIAIKMKQEQKRKALASIYIDAITNKSNTEKDIHSLFVNFISSLTPLQILILYFIEIYETELIEIGDYEKFLESFLKINQDLNIDKYEFKYYSNDLENKSLVSLGGGLADFESTQSLMAYENHKNPSAKLTSLGKAFIKFLKE